MEAGEVADILVQDVAVEKDDSVQRLILSRRRHVLLARQVREESAHLVSMLSARVVLAPKGEAPNPVDVGFLGLHRHVLEAQDVACGFDGLGEVHGL